jgi:membrane protein YdbS with pleckstrin-like domain
MDVYLYLNGARRGPFNAERVRAWLAEGLLRPLDLGSEGADGNLQPLSTFPQLNAAEQPPLRPAEESPPPPISSTPTEPSPPPARSTVRRDDLGPYARATLAPNETPFYRTSLHWIVFVRFALAALAVFLFVAMPFAIAVQAVTASQLGWFALPLPAFMMLTPTLAYVSSELVITNIRVLIKTGVIRRQTLEMFISRIESIAIDQGFFGRMFDYGTVIVRGTGGFEERFEAIARPIEFRNWVQRMQKGGDIIANAGN